MKSDRSLFRGQASWGAAHLALDGFALLCAIILPGPLAGQSTWTACSGSGNILCTTSGSTPVGIGTTSPQVPLQIGAGFGAPDYTSFTPTQLQISDTPTNSTSGMQQGTVSIISQPNPTTDASGANYHALLIDENVPVTSAVSYGATYGAMVRNSYYGTGGVTNGVVGILANVRDYGASSVNDIHGLESNIGIYSNGNQISTVGTSIAISSSSVNASTNGTITSQYGFYDSASNSGTVTNGYGIYISGFGTGGTHTNTPYDVYAADANVYNYFAGNVGIGTTAPPYPLSVKGTIGAGEVIVTNTSGWSDYVFDPGYRLASLSEVAAYVKENHHLPEIPSAKEVEEKGVSLGEMQSKLLAKIEELTLHMVKAEERNNQLEEENRELQTRMSRLEARTGTLKGTK
jgi:hypothetical protein